MNPGSSGTVRRVLAGNLCSGCGLCAAVTGSSMVVDPPGFNRPQIDRPVDSRTDEVISGTCPGAIVAPWGEAPHRHEYWGPYYELRTGYAADARLRHRASSGGVLSAVLQHALDQGLVGAVVEVGPDPERPTGNVIMISTGAEDIFDGAGSRYAPSSPLAQLNALLERNDRMAFVGKPCDVSALRLYARFDPRVAERFPIILSFFCAGIPSLSRSDTVVRKLGLDPQTISSFRYRGEGWPGHAAAVGPDGEQREMSYEDSWGGELSKEIQFRCKICPDAVGGSADLVCADAWYADESGYPTFDDLPGRSLVIARTEVGLKLLEGAVDKQAVFLDPEPVGPDDVDRMQPGQTRKKRLVRSRILALRLLARPVPIMNGVAVREASRRATLAESVRNVLGTMRRVVGGRM